MLQINNLSVHIWEKEILNGISFDFEKGKNYCILWKNGSGKSSLAMTIAWNPKYEISNWDILLNWESLKNLSVDERSKKGIFLSFQNIPEIPWVKLFEFLKAIYDIRQERPTSFMWFKKIIEPLVEELEIDKSFLRRDLNVGFSWGEKRKIEVLQIRLLNPSIIILDEIDSGLDVNAVKQVSTLLKKINNTENTFIIITHLFEMLEGLPIEQVLIIENWKLKETWDENLMNKIKKEGF
jgi:Fe-S cluster assembly ATP-binding protein